MRVLFDKLNFNEVLKCMDECNKFYNGDVKFALVAYKIRGYRVYKLKVNKSGKDLIQLKKEIATKTWEWED